MGWVVGRVRGLKDLEGYKCAGFVDSSLGSPTR